MMMVMEQRRPSMGAHQPGGARRWVCALAGVMLLVGMLTACGVTTSSGTTVSTATSASGTATTGATEQHPAPGCPAVLVDYAGGPLLYWAPPTTVTGPAGTLPTDLCAIGFQPGEHVTLTYVPTGDPSGPAHPAGSVAANANGPFTLPYLEVMPPCIQDGATTHTLQAHGDQGSQTSLRQPVAPHMACQTSGAPR